MGRDPHDIKQRQIARVMRQHEAWYRDGVRREPPSLREAEAQVVRVAQQSDAEKREGRKPTQAGEMRTPDAVRELQSMGGMVRGETGPEGEDIRTRAGGSYADRYTLIDWSN